MTVAPSKIQATVNTLFQNAHFPNVPGRVDEIIASARAALSEAERDLHNQCLQPRNTELSEISQRLSDNQKSFRQSLETWKQKSLMVTNTISNDYKMLNERAAQLKSKMEYEHQQLTAKAAQRHQQLDQECLRILNQVMNQIQNQQFGDNNNNTAATIPQQQQQQQQPQQQNMGSSWANGFGGNNNHNHNNMMMMHF
jgi:dsDNA-specific endonuclease/ATPase MutS2